VSRIFVNGPVSWNLLVHTATLPPPEPHAVFARWHHETLGGTSAGKALNLRRLGLDVTLCTLVGDDALGEQILHRLRAAGIDVIARRSAAGSERHVNLMDPAGRRLSIYLTLPAPAPGRDDDTLRRRRDDAVAAADAVVVDLAEHSREVLAVARAAGQAIWCDLHDYDGRSTFHTDFRDAADHLFLSSERMPDPEAFLRDQVAGGKRLVVCTRGADGAIALDGEGDIVEVRPPEVADVVDTNGAGDAFFAGFFTAHRAGRTLRECLEKGTEVAASCLRSADLVATEPKPPG
jgi:sugar/nucleoside kinase (ribokinase family)